MYRFYLNCHHWKPTSDQWSRAARCLPTDELQRIDQYAYQRDVKFTLAGQLLIRYLLTHVFQQRSSSFVVQRTRANRPYLQSNASFDFNLSHHNELVCIAGTIDGRVGCDTMLYRSAHLRKENYDLFRKKFTEQEYDLIGRNATNFYRLWSLKESYVKWLGIGLGFPLLRLNFHLRREEFSTSEIISDTSLQIAQQRLSDILRFDEQIIPLNAVEQQVITVCLSSTNPCPAFVQLTIDDILHGCTPFAKNKEDRVMSWESFQMKRQTDVFSRDVHVTKK
jgi:4'-phosphopantetheinyl transferase